MFDSKNVFATAENYYTFIALHKHEDLDAVARDLLVEALLSSLPQCATEAEFSKIEKALIPRFAQEKINNGVICKAISCKMEKGIKIMEVLHAACTRFLSIEIQSYYIGDLLTKMKENFESGQDAKCSSCVINESQTNYYIGILPVTRFFNLVSEKLKFLNEEINSLLKNEKTSDACRQVKLFFIWAAMFAKTVEALNSIDKILVAIDNIYRKA